MKIVVQKITPVKNQGNLRAFVDVTVDGTTWNRCRIVQQPGQRPWFALPQISYSHRITGETVYYPALSVPKAEKEAVQEVVLATWADRDGAADEQ